LNVSGFLIRFWV